MLIEYCPEAALPFEKFFKIPKPASSVNELRGAFSAHSIPTYLSGGRFLPAPTKGEIS